MAAPPLRPDEKEAIAKMHSALRWNKDQEEIIEIARDAGFSMAELVKLEDPKNGNRCLHIATQKCHVHHTKFLLQEKADVNAQNLKGQTALHMSVESDFYFQSLVLMEHGADTSIKNLGGHTALTGLDGKKVGKDAWDHPSNILKAAGDNKEELDLAFAQLEKADVSTLDKAKLAKVGMRKEKICVENWDADRFDAFMKRL